MTSHFSSGEFRFVSHNRRPAKECILILSAFCLIGQATEPVNQNFHQRTVSLSFAISCCGLSREPEGNSRSSRGDLSGFTYVPPTSTTRTLLFRSKRLRRVQVLPIASRDSPKTLEDALVFRFCRRACRPAFHYLKRYKAE